MAIHIPKNLRNRYIFLLDLLFIVISVFASYFLRFELGLTFQKYLPSLLWMLGAALIIKPVVYYCFGLYRRLWVYASVNELKVIIVAVFAATAILSAVMTILAALKVFYGFPRLVLIIDGLLSLIFVGGIRFSVRMVSEMENRNRIVPENVKRAFIVGAGDAGAIVCKEIQKNPQLHVFPVGFIDDDPQKQNQEIYGVKVVGTTANLRHLINQYHVGEVFFAIPSAPGRVVRVVSDACRGQNVTFRTMPGIYEMIGGKVNINRLRDVDITDLLRRDPVKLDQDNVSPLLNGKIVLVTGAGGSIGRELCRQIARFHPAKILLLGHGENSIFETMMSLDFNFPEVPKEPVIADVRDAERIDYIFEKYHPQVVFHAAAHKHVYLMEVNVEEAITNNVRGTQNVVNAAKKYGAERFVMISTDKAVRPVNVMGATKRIAENIVLNASKDCSTKFTVVRFGNVLGSRGSVVPIFKQEIARGGPVTITHPHMERYFMTIPEAVFLVLESAGLAGKQETFVLNMGDQVRIIDLAEDLIRLSGLEPGRDIEIKFTGMRPGEKLSEDLWNEGQVLKPTIHPDIFKLDRDDLMDSEKLDQIIDNLVDLAVEGKKEQIRTLLNNTIPDANIQTNSDDGLLEF